jgi:hypothetical protein
MKNSFFYMLMLLFFVSCADPAINNKEQEDISENPIVGKWKLNTHKKAESDKKEVDLKSQPTEVILSIMDGGYFVIYDTFVDPRFSQKGFNRISERSKGQWEFIDEKKLILHHNFEDSTRTEEMDVTLLNKNTLVTKGKDKKSNIYKTYQGY